MASKSVGDLISRDMSFTSLGYSLLSWLLLFAIQAKTREDFVNVLKLPPRIEQR